ncbi:MAG TPA: endonuclease V [Planctomycetaceae bacterium]|nr:endonuclease V [Planctomycetaceae bacterium]
MIPTTDLPGTLRGLLDQIPPGRVTTFGDLAEALGDLSAARWVAQELAEMVDGPVHRVVKRTGEIVLSNVARAAVQRERLLEEGIPITDTGKLDLEHFRWKDFTCDGPLKRLAEWQDGVAIKARNVADVEIPRVMAGLDVSYASDHEAVAAYVEVDVKTHALLFSATHRAAVAFPYITGYLTFRELPIHLALLDLVRQQKPLAKVILVDGAGQLHPRRAGIAVAVGVVGACVTVGVAKHRLVGRKVSEDADPLLEDQGEILGQMLHGTNRTHPVYVSPGHSIALASAVRCVREVWRSGRWPVPIQLADQLSRKIAKQSR